jgi:hypothetical protein
MHYHLSPTDPARIRETYEARLRALDRLHLLYYEMGWALSRIVSALSEERGASPGEPASAGAAYDGIWEEIRAMQAQLSWRRSALDRAWDDLHAQALEDLESGALYGSRWMDRYTAHEAITLFSARSQNADRNPCDELARTRQAGDVLARECERLMIEVETDRVPRSRGLSGPEGSMLSDGEDVGGRRHYLRDEPVHAGERLILLTRWGWIPGRYESGAEGDPLFHYQPIPGSDREICIAIDECMRFAWPKDLAPV